MWNVRRSDFPNLLTRQDGVWRRFVMCLAVLLDHIAHVAIMAVQVKVVRVYAMPHIASMANKLALRDVTVRKYERNHVSAAGLAVKPNLSISARATISGPEPARISFRDRFPKLLNVMRLAVHVETSGRAEDTGTVPIGMKGSRAVKTVACYFESSHCRFLRAEKVRGEARQMFAHLFEPFCILARNEAA